MSLLHDSTLATALAMDACAVALTLGIRAPHISVATTLRIALYFGTFQGTLAYAGYLGGVLLGTLFQQLDHWVAFLLLLGTGLHMLYASLQEDTPTTPRTLSHSALALLALATSIDAAAVGISYALLGSPMLIPALLIGGITALLSALSYAAGKHARAALGTHLERLGGIILISIGIRTLFTHGVFS